MNDDAAGKNAGLIFDAAKIREKGGLSISISPDPAVFAGLLTPPEELTGITVGLVFSVGGESLLLEGSVKAGLRLECARCGEVFTAEFSDTFDEVYEDSVESIDVSGPLREAVSLMPPLKPLCAKECKGLCLKCGANLNRKACGCVPETGPAGSVKATESPFSALKNLSIPPDGKKSGPGPVKKRRK